MQDGDGKPQAAECPVPAKRPQSLDVFNITAHAQPKQRHASAAEEVTPGNIRDAVYAQSCRAIGE